MGNTTSQSTNKFIKSVLVNKTVDDTIGTLQASGYATSWTPPTGDISSKYCTTEFINNNLDFSVTFSTEDPINPDLNPASHTWIKVTSTYPRIVVDVYFWDSSNNWVLNRFQRYMIGFFMSSNSSYSNPDYAFETSADTDLHVVQFQYYAAGTQYLTESNKLSLDVATFDVLIQNYYYPNERTDSTLRFYDANNVYLGKLWYRKNTTTWSTGDYTDIIFYDASGTQVLSVPASNFSGTTYGNGSIAGTVHLEDPTKILFHPPKGWTTHTYGVDRTFIVNHPFSNTRYVTVQVDYFYTTGDGWAIIGNAGSMLRTTV
jgi:hypothetical protein